MHCEKHCHESCPGETVLRDGVSGRAVEVLGHISKDTLFTWTVADICPMCEKDLPVPPQTPFTLRVSNDQDQELARVLELIDAAADWFNDSQDFGLITDLTTYLREKKHRSETNITAKEVIRKIID